MPIIDLFNNQNTSKILNPFYKLSGQSDNSLNNSFSTIDFTRPTLLELDALIINNKIQCLFKPLTVKIEKVDSSWAIENESLRIVAVAKDYDSALRDFAEQIVYLFDDIKTFADKDLTKGGLRLKHELMSYFGGNQPK